MQNVKYKARTIWAGKVWVDAPLLNKANNNKLPLVIDYKGAKMTIPPEELKERALTPKMVESKFPPYQQRKQYGFVWTPDKEN